LATESGSLTVTTTPTVSETVYSLIADYTTELEATWITRNLLGDVS
jgi:hypothetical protein